MAGRKMQIVVFLAAMAAVVGICSAATHTVGDTAGWTIPTSPTLYSSWASKQKLQVGDTLVFNFPAGAHTVAEVSKAAYDSCSASSPISAVLTTAPANLTIKSPGTHYYICTITGHCSAGQKLAITAAASSSSATAPKSSKKGSSAPAPAPAATSTTPPATGETPAAAPGATVPTTTAAAGAPASPTASPPGANFAAPKVAGFGVFGLISVAAAALLA